MNFFMHKSVLEWILLVLQRAFADAKKKNQTDSQLSYKPEITQRRVEPKTRIHQLVLVRY